MGDPKFQTPDGLAATVLVAALIDELMDNGLFGSAHRERILTTTLDQLDAIDTMLAADAADLVIGVFGIQGKMRRKR